MRTNEQPALTLGKDKAPPAQLRGGQGRPGAECVRSALAGRVVRDEHLWSDR